MSFPLDELLHMTDDDVNFWRLRDMKLDLQLIEQSLEVLDLLSVTFVQHGSKAGILHVIKSLKSVQVWPIVQSFSLLSVDIFS